MKFVRDLYTNQAFLDDLEPFVERVKLAGEHASLGALLLHLTAPGVPDIYQGDELWSLNLVDPDNRRPIDWRRLPLEEQAPRPETMKLHLIRRVLRLRAERPEAFTGSYEPLEVGPDRVGFVRGGIVRVVVPLRPRDHVSAEDDLLPEYRPALSIVA